MAQNSGNATPNSASPNRHVWPRPSAWGGLCNPEALRHVEAKGGISAVTDRVLSSLIDAAYQTVGEDIYITPLSIPRRRRSKRLMLFFRSDIVLNLLLGFEAQLFFLSLFEGPRPNDEVVPNI